MIPRVRVKIGSLQITIGRALVPRVCQDTMQTCGGMGRLWCIATRISGRCCAGVDAGSARPVGEAAAGRSSHDFGAVKNGFTFTF